MQPENKKPSNDLQPLFSKPEIVEKKWGKEIVYVNMPEYCLKKLVFNKGAKFSAHSHALKLESWHCILGSFKLTTINPKNAQKVSEIISADSNVVITIPRLMPHQIEALEYTEILEVSTQHFDEDSYRVEAGDSQS